MSFLTRKKTLQAFVLVRDGMRKQNLWVWFKEGFVNFRKGSYLKSTVKD